MGTNLLEIMWMNKAVFFGYFIEFILFGIVSFVLAKIIMNYFYKYLPEKIDSYNLNKSEIVKQPIPMNYYNPSRKKVNE